MRRGREGEGEIEDSVFSGGDAGGVGGATVLECEGGVRWEDGDVEPSD